ncbi:hypothetical protein CFC21_099894 [Triticum aestivum]|uniref:Uncharacterized protein n=2 Tax=Triticum aestivum TaxID=4565 RepID=A0A3B6RQS4_WHEAT|nr:hypothetical protein CFC21_099894 [Triticum aestivum]
MESSSSSSGARSSSHGEPPGYSLNPSPIPYREQPLAYEPSEDCPCHKKAARWISWSNGNPGRRYLTCQRSRVSIHLTVFPSPFLLDLSRIHIFGTLSWRWIDDPTTPFLRQLLVDLRDAVNNVRRENTQLRGVNADLEMGIEDRSTQNNALRDALRKMKEQNQALEEKLGQTEGPLNVKNNGHQKRMLFSVVLIVMIVFLVSKLAA